MKGILTDFSPFILIKAIETSLFECWKIFIQPPSGKLHDSSDMLWFATGVSDSLLNGVLWSQFSQDEIDIRIDNLVSYFTYHNLPMSWYTGPTSKPDNQEMHLKIHGFIHTETLIGMAIDLSVLDKDLSNPVGLTIKRVSNKEMLAEWVNIFKAGYDISDVFAEAMFGVFNNVGFRKNVSDQHYLGFLNEHPVATATLSLKGGVANIYDVSTTPEARRQGIGSIMTSTALNDARKRGYHVGVLQSSEIALSMYRRLGFKEYCRFERFIFGE